MSARICHVASSPSTTAAFDEPLAADAAAAAFALAALRISRCAVISASSSSTRARFASIFAFRSSSRRLRSAASDSISLSFDAARQQLISAITQS